MQWTTGMSVCRMCWEYWKHGSLLGCDVMDNFYVENIVLLSYFYPHDTISPHTCSYSYLSFCYTYFNSRTVTKTPVKDMIENLCIYSEWMHIWHIKTCSFDWESKRLLFNVKWAIFFSYSVKPVHVVTSVKQSAVFIRPLFLCSKSDLLIQVWLYNGKNKLHFNEIMIMMSALINPLHRIVQFWLTQATVHG